MKNSESLKEFKKLNSDQITEKTAKEAMRLAQYKLPVKTKFISIDKNQEETKNSKKSQKEVKQ